MIVIACSADTQVGMGHLMRCRTLADHAQSRNAACIIVGPALTFQTSDDTKRFQDWIAYPELEQLSQTKAEFVADIAHRTNSRHIIADDYSVDGAGQLVLREADLRILQQYDASAAPNFAANLVVNASPAEHADLYRNQLLRDDVEFLHGPRYAVLREAFKHVKVRPNRRPVKRVFVTFGGGDDRGAIGFVIRHISPLLPSGVELVIMTGEQNPNVPELRSMLLNSNYAAVDLQVSPGDVPALMVSCDMAIMGGGTSIAEAAYCGLPMLLSPLVGNQLGQCRGWDKLGAARNLGPFPQLDNNVLASAFADLLSDDDLRADMAAQGRRQIDGHGAERLLDALLECAPKEIVA